MNQGSSRVAIASDAHKTRLGPDLLSYFWQAESFVLNVESLTSSDYTALGGHGFDGTLECGLVRCPMYDDTYITNLGTRWVIMTPPLPSPSFAQKDEDEKSLSF